MRKRTEDVSKSRITELRARDRQRKARQRLEAAALFIPAAENTRRRKRLEADTPKWLAWYFPNVFTKPFQPHQLLMIEAIQQAAIFRGDQAIAGPRGEGKSVITECMTINVIVRGLVSFAAIFAATARDSADSLGSIKEFIESSDRLAADYPGLCLPVREVASAPQKARSVVVFGKRFKPVRADFQWSGTEISMPKVPGLHCAGARIATRGLESAIRGLKKGTMRPELAIIDDPDTEDTARSEEQANKLIDRIDRAIALLAPQGRRISRVMLTTIQNHRCVSAQFTDPKLKPSWNGKRLAFLVKKPNREDLWDEYIAKRQQERAEGDEFARKAHRLYLRRRKAMDAGAEVASPTNFDDTVLPDGSRLQVSSLQRYYDFVADSGLDAALCELQNDPPEETGPIESGISSHRVQTQVSGYDRKMVPPGCTVVTQGIDCRKVALHKVVRAWRPDGTGFTIDYGVEEVHGTIVGSDEGVDVALFNALRSVDEFLRTGPYVTVDGEVVPVALTLVDAGWRTEAIYHACRELGLGWMPAMGFGQSAGCVKTRFEAPVRRTMDKKPGDGWFLSRRPKGVWLVCMDSDRWKAWEHDRWMTPTDKPGTMMIFGEPGTGGQMSQDQKSHFSYSKHIVAEVEVEEPIRGQLVRHWKAKSDTNHYFDASYMSDVAANMKGISLLRSSTAAQAAPQPEGSSWFAKQGKTPRRAS